MMQGLQKPIPQRMQLVRFTAVLALVVSSIVSLPLWGGQRDFPYAPLLPLPTLLPPFDYLIIGSVVLLLLLSLIARWSRLLTSVALLVLCYLVLADVERMQFWVLAYGGLLFVLLFYNGRVDNANRFTSYFILLQIIVAAIYFFTGLHQLNPGFTQKILPEVMQPIRVFVSDRQFQILLNIGRAAPFVLMFIGIGFVLSPIRYLAFAMALVLHLCLFLLLFPSPHCHDYALWLSNLFFPLLVLFLFSGKTKQRYYSPLSILQIPVFYVVITFFVILPFFNLNNQWPDALSLKVLSGNEKQMTIQANASTFRKLSYYEEHFYDREGENYTLNYHNWCRHELHAQVVTDWPVFKALISHIEEKNPDEHSEQILAEVANFAKP